MGNNVNRLWRISALLGSMLLVMAVSAPEENNSSVYDQVLQKLGDLEPDEFIEMRMGMQKEHYALDEQVEIRFMSSTDCYATLMFIDTDGKIIFLLPNSLQQHLRITGGRVYSTGSTEALSAEEAQYALNLSLTAATPEGKGILNLFCSPEQIALFDANFEEGGVLSYYEILPGDEQRLRTLSDRLDQLAQGTWSGTSVRFSIGQEPTPVPDEKRASQGRLKRRLRSSGTRAIFDPIGSAGTTGAADWFPPIGSAGTTGKRSGE